MLSTVGFSPTLPVSKCQRLAPTFLQVPSAAKKNFKPDALQNSSNPSRLSYGVTYCSVEELEETIFDNKTSEFSEVQPPVKLERTSLGEVPPPHDDDIPGFGALYDINKQRKGVCGTKRTVNHAEPPVPKTEWSPKNEEPPNKKIKLWSTPDIRRREAAAKKRDATLQARTNAEFDKAEEEGNKGEKAEVQIKKILKSETEKESSPLLRTLFNLGPTDTVLFPTQSMKKAANKEKADCFMEVEQDQSNEIYKMSIKYVGSGDCSIVNQDHRAKKAYSPDWRNREEGVLFHCLGGIDSLISRLNYERAIGDRSQDIPFINIDFTEVERKAMEALLVHHTFIGAGTGAFQPHVQSNCILIVGNVQDPNTWRLTPCFTDDDKKKYIQSKWDKYTLAIRGKGMQVEQSYRTDALPQHQLARWVSVWALPRFINRVEKKGYSYPVDGCEYVGNWWEKPKCTLNIRMKK